MFDGEEEKDDHWQRLYEYMYGMMIESAVKLNVAHINLFV